MTTRTTGTVVTFRHPFMLERFGDVLPPGSYDVDMEEEQQDTVSVAVWKRVSTTIRLNREGAIEYLPVDPDALRTALARDAAQG